MKNGSDIVGQTGQVNSQMSTAVEWLHIFHKTYTTVLDTFCFNLFFQ